MDARFQFAQALFRRTRLLPVAMGVRYGVEVAMNYPANRRFASAHPEFPTPPAKLAFDAYANVSREYYWTSGRDRAADIASYVRRHSNVPTPSFFEWGCGCARILRHMVDELPGSEIAGSDYNPESIAWCKEQIPGITFELNGLAPPLPFADAQFDFVFALSVLTHLSEEMHFAWFEELRRVTKPGGVIMVSVHGEAFVPLLLPGERDAWQRGDLIVRGGVEEGKRMYLSFHPERFMRERLLVDCEILEHVADRGERKQDFWVVRRP